MSAPRMDLSWEGAQELLEAHGGELAGWQRGARVWGSLTAVAFLIATVVWAVEALGLLGQAPPPAQTSAGRSADEVTWWTGYFQWRHETLWNLLLRDTLFVVAYLGTVPLMLALARVTGRMVATIAAAFAGIVAAFGILNAITDLAATDDWRSGDWADVPDQGVGAVGRDT